MRLLQTMLAVVLLGAGCYASEPSRESVRVAPGVTDALERGEAVDVIVAFDADSGECAAGVAAGEANELDSIDGMSMRVVRIDSVAALNKLLERSDVDRVELDAVLVIEETDALALVGQPSAYAAGLHGAGGAVAIVDTGVDHRHADLGRCEAAGEPGCAVVDSIDIAPDDGEADAHGHGTNVAAIVRAVAPSARIVSLDVAEGRNVATSSIIRAIAWIVAHREAHDIVAINISVGGGVYDEPCGDSLVARAIACARRAGIVTVVSSGNDGMTGALSSPACAPEAVSVGAVYAADVGSVSYPSCRDASTERDRIACFTNVSPTLSLLAPGVLVSGGGRTLTGTSQAAPFVAGAIALVAGARRAEGPAAWIDVLRGHGQPLRDRRSGVRFPRLDLRAVAADLADR